MKDKHTWDWQTDKKEIPIKDWQDAFNWVEEPYVSPDGEKIAAIVNQDEAEFSVCVNGETWEESFEKAWSLKFASDGKLAVLASKDEEWSVCRDGVFWETWFDFIWDLQLSADGQFISVAVQKDSQYGMAVNDVQWDTLYDNINGMVLSDQGTSAAIVQAQPLGQADLDSFDAGIFSIAVNGVAHPEKFMNAWDLCFDGQGKQVAYAIRKNRSDYSLVKNNTIWDSVFQSIWKPEFFNQDQSVVAPARVNGKWVLFKDGTPFWNKRFWQLWKLSVHNGSQKIAGIVSDDYGKWTVCENNKTWNVQCNNMISDLSYSDDGSLLIAICKHDGLWDMIVNQTPWHLKADKLWQPVVSSDNHIITTRMEKDGKYYLIINKKVYPQSFDMVFEPQISPDNEKILLKSINSGIYSRQVLSLDKVL